MSDRTPRVSGPHLRTAVEFAPNGLMMSDADGRIVYVNHEVVRMFGHSREELLGQPVELLVPERFREAHAVWRAGLHEARAGRAMGVNRDMMGRRKDGSELPLEIGLTPFTTDDGQFVLASLIDISERRRMEHANHRLEEQLRQSQKLETVGALAGGIAHDFNNILGGIIGYAELLADQVERGSGADKDVEQILAAAMRGRRLVDRILSFTRRREAEHRPTDLGDMVREVQHFLRSTLPAEVKLQLRLPPSVPPVMADATSVHKVLMNLASNAAHAMEHGGILDISLEPFYVTADLARAHPGLHEGPHLSLDVRDNGAGMNAQTRALAFEPFFTTKPEGTGTGLGLSTVRSILQAHGGAVLLDSAVGVGTQVRCLFPLHEEPPVDEISGESLAVFLRGHNERILCVDDEASLLEATARRLERLGYRVNAMTRPAHALAMLRAEPTAVDLLICDLSMPEMTGADLASAARRVRPDLPVILLTGYVDHVTEGMVRKAGISLVLKKPAVQAELARACRVALGDALDAA